MIEYLSDSCTGIIEKYPYVTVGSIWVKTPGNTTHLSNCPSGSEVLKFDSDYIYARDLHYPERVNVINIDGNIVKTMLDSELD